MEKYNNNSTSREDGDSLDSSTDGRNPALGENSTDEILEEDRPKGDEYRHQVLDERAGENLETQTPTQEQTAGEDDVGGFSDEELEDDEGAV